LPSVEDVAKVAYRVGYENGIPASLANVPAYREIATAILAMFPSTPVAEDERTHHAHIFEDCSCGDDGCARKVCVLCELVVDLHAPSTPVEGGVG
jgi:hypothetical protein